MGSESRADRADLPCSKCHAEPRRPGSSWGPECHKKAAARWRKENPEKVKATLQKWRGQHAEEMAAQRLRRRAAYFAWKTLAARYPEEYRELLEAAVRRLRRRERKKGEPTGPEEKRRQRS